MRKVALVWYRYLNHPNCFIFTEGEEPLLSCLAIAETLPKYGIEAKFEVWNDPHVNWSSYDLVILLATHDYIYYIEEYMSWLDMLVAKGIPVHNPVDVVKWNIDKHYLLDLQNRGCDIPKTQIVRKEELNTVDIGNVMQTHGWEKCVLKPCISCSSHDLYLLQTEAEVKEMQDKLISIYEGRDIIIQEFIPGVKQGEYSCYFFGKEYSHTILKVPAEDDFRCLFLFGATTSRAEPPPEVFAAAEQAIVCGEKEVLIARVDVIQRDSGAPLIMELEMLDPALYLTYAPECVDIFCKAIRAEIN